MPSIALRLFEHGDQPCQRGRVEAGSYRNASFAGQLDVETCNVVRRLPVRRRTLDQFNGNKRESWAAGRGRSGILRLTWATGALSAIVVQCRHAKAMLTAKYSPRKTALFKLHDQPIRLFPAPATTRAMCLLLTHEPSTSPAELQGKNGLARRGTIDSADFCVIIWVLAAVGRLMEGQKTTES
jgi:hypothetical protein